MEFIYRSLRDPQQTLAVRGFGMLFSLAGLLVGGYWGYVCAQRLSSFSRPAYTTSVRGWGDPFYGGFYVAIVNGREVVCTGSDLPYSKEDRVAVVYDLDAPSHCRKADRRDELSSWEWRCLLGYVCFIFVGSFLLTIRENERSRLRWVFCRACLGAAVAALTASLYLVITVTGV